MTARSENQIQRDVLDYLNAVGVISAHVPNGAVLAGSAQQRAIQMNSLKRNGFRSGFPDLILMDRKHQARVGFFEVKADKGKLSEKQIYWQFEFEQMGIPWALVRSVDDAENSLREWGWR